MTTAAAILKQEKRRQHLLMGALAGLVTLLALSSYSERGLLALAAPQPTAFPAIIENNAVPFLRVPIHRRDANRARRLTLDRAALRPHNFVDVPTEPGSPAGDVTSMGFDTPSGDVPLLGDTVGLVSPASAFAPAFGFGPGGGGGAGGGGGGAGGGGGGGTDTPATPSVPEPASWLLMLSGFGLTGAFLRARRATPTGSVSR